MTGELNLCVDSVHEVATVYHASDLVRAQFNLFDILLETSLALAVLGERCNACARDVYGGSGDYLFVSRLLFCSQPIL